MQHTYSDAFAKTVPQKQTPSCLRRGILVSADAADGGGGHGIGDGASESPGLIVAWCCLSLKYLILCEHVMEASVDELLKAGLGSGMDTLVDSDNPQKNFAPANAGPEVPELAAGSPCKHDAYAVVDVEAFEEAMCLCSQFRALSSSDSTGDTSYLVCAWEAEAAECFAELEQAALTEWVSGFII